MKFSFTHHAQFRIHERGISSEAIKQTIKHPDKQKIDEHGMMVARKKVSGRVLEVVYRRKKTEYVIITAYYEN